MQIILKYMKSKGIYKLHFCVSKSSGLLCLDTVIYLFSFFSLLRFTYFIMLLIGTLIGNHREREQLSSTVLGSSAVKSENTHCMFKVRLVCIPMTPTLKRQ